MIDRFTNMVVVHNNQDKKWVIPFEIPGNDDTSLNGVVADIASAMLTGTIASQLKESNAPTIRYTLTIDAI